MTNCNDYHGQIRKGISQISCTNQTLCAASPRWAGQARRAICQERRSVR